MFTILKEECQPTRTSKYSAGVNLKSSIHFNIEPGETVKIPLGIKIDLASIIEKKLIIMPAGFYNAIQNDDEDFFLTNDVDYSYKEELAAEIDGFLKRHYFQITIEDKLSKNLMLTNGITVVDIDNSNELFITVHNPIKANSMFNDIEVKKGQEVAQILLMEHRSSFFDIAAI